MQQTEKENEMIKDSAEPEKVDRNSEVEQSGNSGTDMPESIEAQKPEKAEAEKSDNNKAEKSESAEGEKPKRVRRRRVRDFDYVAPEQTFKEHMRNPTASSTHTGKTKMASKEEMDQASEGYIFLTPSSKKGHKHHHHHHHHHHSSSSSERKKKESSDLVDPTQIPRKHHSSKRHRHRRKPLWLRILIIVGIVLLSIAVVLAGTYFVMREIGRRDLHDHEEIVLVTPTEEKGEEIMDVVENGRTIVYEGKTYNFNENIVSIAVIGVDHDIENNAVQSMGDSVNIVALNTETGEINVVAVSRDTMTDVNLYSDEGAYIDTERLQLAYAYSFGNKYLSGGENTLSSLSKLFFGLPMKNYFAINMEALISLNDAIGGVTLTSSISFTSRIDGTYISEGDTVTLYGRDADYYVRNREIEELDSNNGRMQRQQEYIRAFFSQVFPMIKKDLSLVSKLYEIIQVNSDTNLDLPKIIYLASVAADKMKGEPQIGYLSIKGGVIKGEYAEFIADDRSVLEAMLKVFYTEVE